MFQTETIVAHGNKLVKRASGIEMAIIATCVLDHATNDNTAEMRKVLKGTAYKVKAPKIADNLATLKAFNVADIIATAKQEDDGSILLESAIAAIEKAIRVHMKSVSVTSTNSYYAKLNKLVKGETENETDADATETDATETDDETTAAITIAPAALDENADIQAFSDNLALYSDNALSQIIALAEGELLARAARMPMAA